MATNQFTEINSFIGKFTSLWQQGHDASLFMEAQAGKAYIVLRLGLGENPHLNTMHPQRVSPSRLRRRERRAAARRDSAVKAETVSNGSSEKHDSTSSDVGEVSKSEGVHNKPAEIVAENEIDELEVVSSSDEITKNYDEYIFSYRNNKKLSNEREASHCIAVKLKQNFLKNGVGKADQVLKICKTRSLEDNEVEVSVLMKKDQLPVELSARNCQTTSEDVPVSISLKKICR